MLLSPRLDERVLALGHAPLPRSAQSSFESPVNANIQRQYSLVNPLGMMASTKLVCFISLLISSVIWARMETYIYKDGAV